MQIKKRNTTSESLRYQLQALSADIAKVKWALLTHPQLAQQEGQAVAVGNDDPLTRLTDTIRRGSRLFRRMARVTPNDDRQDHEPLLSLIGPDDSQETLVDAPAAVKTVDADSLLNTLAPVVSELQRLAPQVISYLQRGLDSPLGVQFTDICVELLDIVNEIRQQAREVTDCRPKQQEHFSNVLMSHDQDMRDLLLAALTTKVEREYERLTAIKGLPAVVTPPDDPFVLHSTSLPALPRANRATRGSTPIKIGPGSMASSDFDTNTDTDSASITLINGSSSSHLYPAQGSQGWARNLVRLGSYQASLLFSNSPVAVRAQQGAIRL
ncbi:hypothetical protein IAU60_004172 [Kwoniella sp. DSM 27419]